jgi:hypothetical protein
VLAGARALTVAKGVVRRLGLALRTIGTRTRTGASVMGCAFVCATFNTIWS